MRIAVFIMNFLISSEKKRKREKIDSLFRNLWISYTRRCLLHALMFIARFIPYEMSQAMLLSQLRNYLSLCMFLARVGMSRFVGDNLVVLIADDK